MSLLFPRRARFWGPKRTPKTASTVGLPTVGSPPVSLVFGYRNRPPEPGLSPRSKPVSCVEFWLARPQHIFEFVNHSRTGLLGRRCCETQTINQLRRCVSVSVSVCVGVCCVCLQMFRSVQMPRSMFRSVLRSMQRCSDQCTDAQINGCGGVCVCGRGCVLGVCGCVCVSVCVGVFVVCV